jgi:hypothetical protein
MKIKREYNKIDEKEKIIKKNEYEDEILISKKLEEF